jgi:hypothetical protein
MVTTLEALAAVVLATKEATILRTKFSGLIVYGKAPKFKKFSGIGWE